MRAATDPDGAETGGERRHDVVVDAVAHIDDLCRVGARFLDDMREEPRRRLLDAPPLRRADEVDVRAEEVLVDGAHVAGGAEAQAALAQRIEAWQRVGMEVSIREYAGRGSLGLPALVRGGLVHERLSDVEDDDGQRHADTVSRSAGEVTLSRRGSPSTILTRPPAASTRPAQSVASAPSA